MSVPGECVSEGFDHLTEEDDGDLPSRNDTLSLSEGTVQSNRTQCVSEGGVMATRHGCLHHQLHGNSEV